MRKNTFIKSTNKLLAIFRRQDTRLVVSNDDGQAYALTLIMKSSQPWPIVESFLRHLKPGSVGLDVGCGNGKYLTVNQDVFIIASDR